MDKRILYVHGWATDGWVWEDTARTLDREALIINLPGHGGKGAWGEASLSPAVAEASSVISGKEGIIGMGWSLGVEALIECALQEKDRFSALVLVGATPCFVEQENFPWGQAKALVKRMIMDMKKDPSSTVERFYSLNFTDEELKGEKAKAFINRYRYPGPVNCSTEIPGCLPAFRYDEMTRALEALYTADIRDGLKELAMPVLLIHGGKDTICPVGAAQYMSARIKNARLEIFEEAGHAPFLTENERFLKSVNGFLNGLK